MEREFSLTVPGSPPFALTVTAPFTVRAPWRSLFMVSERPEATLVDPVPVRVVREVVPPVKLKVPLLTTLLADSVPPERLYEPDDPDCRLMYRVPLALTEPPD